MRTLTFNCSLCKEQFVAHNIPDDLSPDDFIFCSQCGEIVNHMKRLGAKDDASLQN